MVKKAVQQFARKKDLKVSAEFYNALDKKINLLLEEAAKRSTDNKRKTLKACDL
ncbi:MAG: DUF1931 domain-containing protein [Candidatus Thorarchaeota archaeon]|nr:MAG: DUF1931 domain-containing protein [Candidatus Thorarchaeota archaeon]